jgi:ubiquinone/menaquinone biosynthesis C-methylase UbiE
MPTLVLMQAFENAPARYDGAMHLLTFGSIGRVKAEIASRVAGAGRRVLELGCGTGSLAIMMARTGARVLAIDTSEEMLAVARRRIEAEGLAERVELRRLSALEVDTLPRASFDAVVCTLVLSELSDDEIRYVLAQTRALLAPAGQLLIADDVVPAGLLRRVTFALLRLPLRLLAYLIGQAQGLAPRRRAATVLYFAIELPLMLLVFFCVPPASRPFGDLAGRLEAAGFRVTDARGYLGGTLALVQAGAR